MADETTQLIVGDAAVDALGSQRKRRFFRRKKAAPPPITRCANCEAPLAGEFCAKCGQHAIDYHRSFGAVLIDAADSFFNWDTKFLKSVGVLLIRPWRLTNDFNAGRRVRFVHPLRLYLLASIAFFLVVKVADLNPSTTVKLSAEDRANIASALGKLTGTDSPLTAEQRARIDALRTTWSSAVADPKQQAKIDRAMLRLPRFATKRKLKPEDIEKLEAAVAKIETLAAPPPPPAPAPPGEEGQRDVSPPPVAAMPSPPEATSDEFQPLVIDAGDDDWKANTPFEKWLKERVKEKIGEHGSNAKLFVETLRSNIPTMMLCCIPLFALVLKLLYVRQRRLYIEHLVYALHIHTFAYVAVVVITLIALGTNRWLGVNTPLITVALSCAAFALVFVSIRRVYRQGWFMTTFKFLLGASIYLFVLVFAVGVTAFVTLILP